MKDTVLVTGGAGYIGSHTCIELIAAGFLPVVVDNLCNSKRESLRRVGQICGQEIPLHAIDLRDTPALTQVCKQYQPQAVIHFAGLKAVGESCQLPLAYYDNNVAGTVSLLKVMQNEGIKQCIFSSSATVYGDPASVPIDERFPTQATNPYGRSKLMVEEMLRDICAAANSDWQVCLLRYFNPVGAHASGLIGEDPNGIPNNLLPYVSQVAVGKLERLRVFGGDYPTVDGTGVRDYIHVVDLARGHINALQAMASLGDGCHTFNLGTGTGYSVLEVVKGFEQATGKVVPYEVVARRAGDIAECYANPEQARQHLGWQAQYNLQDMLKDTWRWQSQNPDGYGPCD